MVSVKRWIERQFFAKQILIIPEEGRRYNQDTANLLGGENGSA